MKASRFQIERGGVGDVESLRELWLELHHHHQEIGPQSGEFTDDDTSWGQRAAQYRRWLGEDPGSFVLLARDDEGLAAYALVRVMEPGPELLDAWRLPERIAELETIVVTARARGAGLGTHLLDEVDAELERQGIEELMIGLIPGNDGAQRLYESRGFKPRWLMLARSSRSAGS
jgi:ribosomal protein S18 acetylase RimI-like enzyme